MVIFHSYVSWPEGTNHILHARACAYPYHRICDCDAAHLDKKSAPLLVQSSSGGHVSAG